MSVLYMNPEIQPAIISAFGSILSTAIGAATASLIGKRFLKQEKLKQDLEAAISDIEFLLLVEKEHCTESKERSGRSNFQTVRNRIRVYHSWSGKFTPGRAKGLRDSAN